MIAARRAYLIGLVATVLVSGLPACASTVELYMFERDGCPYCAQFNREIAPGYHRSPEGQLAPLRRIDWKAQLPTGVSIDKPVNATPTFVLIKDGKEAGRITGYPGADFFYWLLTGVLEQAGVSSAPK